jgi:hypothetical protein
MRKRVFMLAVLAATAFCATAASLNATFGGGVLGVAWGASLTNVVGIYPQGDHIFAVTPGCRAYWVKDGQTFLGVPRDGHGVLFALDQNNRVGAAAIAFDYERKDELQTVLGSLLGTPINSTRSSGKFRYGWRSSDGMTASVTEFGEGTQSIIWLVVATPGYKNTKDGWQSCVR